MKELMSFENIATLVLLGLGLVSFIVLKVYRVKRRKHAKPNDERQRKLDAAVAEYRAELAAMEERGDSSAEE